jgi:flagellar protein FliL
MAEAGEVKEANGGKGGFVVALLLLAVLGGGAGAGFSMTFLNPGSDHNKDPAADAGVGKQGSKAASVGTKPGDTSGTHGKTPAKAGDGEVPKDQIVNLDPILVTLAGPQRSWARLELGVLIEPVEKEDPAPLLKTMSENIMSFLRTVPLTHIETAAGLEYLREDLSEIVRLRSKGRVRGVVLRSLVVE